MADSKLKAIFGVAVVVAVSKIAGLAREMVIADRFGTSGEYDLYLIAVMLPALAYGVTNFASYYLFVPALGRRFDPHSHDAVGAWRYAWTLLGWTLTAALVVAGGIILLSPWLMKIWAGDFTAEEFRLVVFYSRLTALGVVLMAIEAFLRSLLNVRKVFSYPAGGTIVFNVVAIVCIVLFFDTLSVGAIAIGLLAGLSIQVMYLAMRVISLRPTAGFGLSAEDSLRPLLATAGVLVIIESLNRSYFLIDRYFATDFGEGVISALNYSQVLVQLPDSVIGLAIASVAFPFFVQGSDKVDGREFFGLYAKSIVGGLLVAVPLAVIFFAGAEDIIRTLLVRGRFDADSLVMTAHVLRPLVPTIIALFVISTSVRACYARRLTVAVLVLTVVMLLAKFVATALLPQRFGYPGISAATTISQVLFAAGLIALVVRRHGGDQARRMLGQVVRVIIAGAVAAVAVWYVVPVIRELIPAEGRVDALLRVAAIAAVTVVVYLAGAMLLGLGQQMKAVLAGKRWKSES